MKAESIVKGCNGFPAQKTIISGDRGWTLLVKCVHDNRGARHQSIHGAQFLKKERTSESHKNIHLISVCQE